MSPFKKKKKKNPTNQNPAKHQYPIWRCLEIVHLQAEINLDLPHPWTEHPFHYSEQVESFLVVQHMKPPTYLEEWGRNGYDGQAGRPGSLMD